MESGPCLLKIQKKSLEGFLNSTQARPCPKRFQSFPMKFWAQKDIKSRCSKLFLTYCQKNLAVLTNFSLFHASQHHSYVKKIYKDQSSMIELNNKKTEFRICLLYDFMQKFKLIMYEHLDKHEILITANFNHVTAYAQRLILIKDMFI